MASANSLLELRQLPKFNRAQASPAVSFSSLAIPEFQKISSYKLYNYYFFIIINKKGFPSLDTYLFFIPLFYILKVTERFEIIMLVCKTRIYMCILLLSSYFFLII